MAKGKGNVFRGSGSLSEERGVRDVMRTSSNNHRRMTTAEIWLARTVPGQDCLMLSPTSRVRLMWDFMSAVCLVYVAIVL